jgi:hypothetical protein
MKNRNLFLTVVNEEKSKIEWLALMRSLWLYPHTVRDQKAGKSKPTSTNPFHSIINPFMRAEPSKGPTFHTVALGIKFLIMNLERYIQTIAGNI